MYILKFELVQAEAFIDDIKNIYIHKTHLCPRVDGNRTPDFAKLFLDLATLYLNMILMLSRLGEERMLIPWLMIQLGDLSKGGVLEAILQFLCDPSLAKRPLIVAYLGRD